MIKNIFTNKLGINLPIMQAPMAGGATTPELVASVSEAGGLGSLGAGYMQPQEIKAAINKIRALTGKPFAVNLFIPEEYIADNKKLNNMQQIIQQVCLPELNYAVESCNPPYIPIFEEQLKVIIEEKVPIFSFTFGIPEQKYIAELKNNHIITIGTATNISEAISLENSGIDIIVAQGSEAGGHRGTFLKKSTENNLIGLMSLIPQITDKVKIPVIAAGGIMDSRGIVAALTLGASGVAMGSAFLTCHESGIHAKYKEALLNLQSDNTILSKSFSGKLARGINNTFIQRMLPYVNDILDYPIQNKLTQNMRKQAALQNNPEFMSMWAGQNAYLCKPISAQNLIAELTRELNYMEQDS